MPFRLIAEEGPHQGLVLNLEAGEEWIIGRDPDESSFVIEDHAVSRRHAKCIRTSEGIYLENLSRVSPTLVNDEPVDGQVLLKEGDRVQIGHTMFRFSKKRASKEELPVSQKGGYEDIFGSLDEPSESVPVSEEPEEPEKASFPSRASAYDTIFEDGGEGADFPFNLLSESPLLLKVISGPNAGAEIGLEKARTYTLGKDPASCDIVFQDLSVSRHHARLSISSEGILEIEDLSSKNGTVVNGTAVVGKKHITTQDLIALGTTVFLIIDREAPQETIYSPIAPSYEPPGFERMLPEEPSPSEVAPPAEEKKRNWKTEPIPAKHLIMAAGFAVIFLIVFLTFFSLFKAKHVEMAPTDPIAQIKKALAKFEGVQFSFNPASGKLFLAGHVVTAVDAQEMRYRIGEIGAIQSTEDNVVIDEMVDKTMNDVLSGNPNFRGVAILSSQPGKFIVSGYVATLDVSAALTDYLSVHFPYLDRLENQVVAEDALNMQIQAVLQGRGFSAIAFQYTNGSLVLSGNYSNKMENEFQSLLKQIGQIPGISSIKNYAAASSPQLAAIDVSQQFQVSGLSQRDGRGYNVVLNGKLYVLGDAVSGMTITDIDPSTILLEKDGIKYKINYTR